MTNIKSELNLSHETGASSLGESDAFLDFQTRLSLVAKAERSAIIIGERGTGKELAARRMHFLSPRWGQALVTINCAALSPAILESELFGHEPGSFTGAQKRRIGRFEKAHLGTLFLDELGAMPLAIQEKLLRVVEYGEFERMGSSDSINVDIRIVAATNADLPELCQQGKFKKDLLDRLAFEVLHLPPLRDRQGDIQLLANHFACHMAQELERQDLPQFNAKSLAQLQNYIWPGNIRELKNVVERAVFRSTTSIISEVSLNPFDSPYSTEQRVVAHEDDSREIQTTAKTLILDADFDLKQAVKTLEQNALNQALELSQYNQSRAAKILGLAYHQFRALLRKYHR